MVPLALSCRTTSPAGLSDRAESRVEAYVKVESIASLPLGQVFQFRLRGHSEQCVVPFREQMNVRQCDGKAHWRLVFKSQADSGIIRIQHTVAPVCLTVTRGTINFEFQESLTKVDACDGQRFDLRFDGELNDREGRRLSYLPSPTNPGQQQKLDLWIPVRSADTNPMITSWNLDLNYSPPFLLPHRLGEKMIYESDGWSPSNRRWLAGIFVYSDTEKTRIKGLKTIYSDGINITANNLGACNGEITKAGCHLLEFVEIDQPPQETLSAQELAEKYNFLTAVSVLHNGDEIVGLKFSGNRMAEKTVIAPHAEQSKLKLSPIKLAYDREDQVITGFYGSYGQLNDAITSGYLKDLGVIAGRYQTYAKAWQEEITKSEDGTSYPIRKSETPFDAFGPTTVPANSDAGYFETVAATDPVNRHWISSIALLSGGGIQDIISNGPANLAIFETNDVIGIKILHSLTDDEGAESAHELLVGYAHASKQPNPVMVLDEYEYLSKVEYRPLVPAFSETISENTTSRSNYTFVPTAGIAALRITISNIKDANQRVITWDTSDPDYKNPAVARTTAPSFSNRSVLSDWINLGSDPERAIIGFYGIANNVLNPNYHKEKRYIPAIKSLGVITTTVGCAFRFKIIKHDLDVIREAGKVALEQVGDGTRTRCLPPSTAQH